MPRPTRTEIEERMRKGEVPGVSIAYLDSKKAIPIEPLVLGATDVHANTPHVPVEEDTVFGAASLSKPVFSYLVLKLIADKKLSTAEKPFDLDTPISEILPIEEFYGKEVSSEFSVEAKKITSRMVLSHTTGIPINGAPRVDFEPGTQYAYGNTALYYLQKAIEKQTGQSLETLAQEEVFIPLEMSNSSFLPPANDGLIPHAANSLHTTASDYARFAAAWMQEKDCSLVKMSVDPTTENQKDSESSRYILTKTGFFYYNKSKGTVQTIELDEAGSKLADLHSQFSDVTEGRPIERLSDKALSQITTITGHTNPLQEAFRPAIPLTKDQWAIDMGVAEEDRQHLAWGLGLGLQLDDKGEVTTAFHSGDMNQWRGWVAMDVKAKSAVVYFANGDDAKNDSGHGYGHVLADVIVSPEVELTHGLDWFFQKFGVSRNVEPGWKAKEETDTARIDTYVRSRFAAPIETIMIEQAKIPGMSIATISSDGEIVKKSVGVTDRGNKAPQAVTDVTVFQAASLSKPVFAYIVLKMVEDGKFSRPGEAPESGLDRPLHEICDFGPPELRDHPNYKLLTPRNLLSHQASLPNWFKPGEPEAYVGAADVATVETRFDYSGLAYCFLNEVVEHIAGKPLDELSREVFDDESLEMNHTSFVPFPEESDKQTKRAVGHKADGSPDKRAPSLPSRANPAASLVTTAEDYAKFLNACLHDEFIRSHMFEPQLNLAGKDKKAMDAKVSEETLRQVSWGIGMGLQTADNRDPIAFHWGDNETSRAFTAINLRTNEAVVCFTNSANGPSVFQQIAEPVVGSLTPVSQWLSRREGLVFAEDRVSHDAHLTTTPKTTGQYKDKMQEIRKSEPGYMASTESSRAKEREKYTPFQTTPKPPWKL